MVTKREELRMVGTRAVLNLDAKLAWEVCPLGESAEPTVGIV